MLAPPEREDFPRRSRDSLRWTGVLHLYFPALPARRCNVGFFCRAAHTLAVGAESRTQRRHAPHGAVQALGAPAGSIVPIFFTGGKSALSARLREIHRLPLLRYVSAKIPFSLILPCRWAVLNCAVNMTYRLAPAHPASALLRFCHPHARTFPAAENAPRIARQVRAASR